MNDTNTSNVYVEMAPVRHGFWAEKIDMSGDLLYWRKYYCSQCGDWQIYGETNFCMNCGAVMDKETNRNA